MSSNINNYVRPTDDSNRRDINKILELIHDLSAQEPEDAALQERIMFTPHVKRRTTSVTFGAATELVLEYKDRFISVWRRNRPSTRPVHGLSYATTGTLTFPASGNKHGGNGTFDGLSYITITHNSSLQPTDKLSFGGFFYLPATDAGDTASQDIVDKGNYSLKVDPHATAANQLRATFRVDGQTGVLLETESSTTITTETPLDLELDNGFADFEVTGTFTPDTWNHIWVVWDGTDLKLYIEKIETSTITATGSLVQNTQDCIIG
jgi:hypothetical protein